ncbi:hypothetical protein NX774_00820 [Massilia agilis]|uniref:Uncharacterized protein n=1 Tax=Massilia agilis TaxID=1811226 RepID=A0ABT2D573_9BURK|nr:hypothetical protein [Massilia agilis]MCS0806467.1 hypothetical protein [Massilia agilis]
MAENKGRGVKGANYDELSGIGTSEAGVTGTTGNLNTGGRDGGVGMPSRNDAGNLQNADLGEHGDTPALGSRVRGPHSRQGGQQQGQQNAQGGQGGQQSQQSGQGGSLSGPGDAEQQREDSQTAANPNIQGGTRSR